MKVEKFETTSHRCDECGGAAYDWRIFWKVKLGFIHIGQKEGLEFYLCDEHLEELEQTINRKRKRRNS